MKRRGTVVFLLGTFATLALVALAYWWLLAEPAPPAIAPAPAAAAPAADRVRLVKADGVVEVRAASGDWSAVKVGTEVDPGSDLRTRGDGTASLSYGRSMKISLRADSRVRVGRRRGKVTRVTVGRGLAIIDVQPGTGRLVQVAAEGSDAVTETRNGRVNVLNDGRGTVQTAVTRGSAVVRAHGKSVTLKSGYASRVRKGHAPEAPMPLPKSLFLKVKWPPELATAKRRHRIVGTASPGARVRVGDQVVTADASGHFQAIVKLHEGRNRIRVFALDVAGRHTEKSSKPILLDTHAPTHAVQTSPDMWKNAK